MEETIKWIGSGKIYYEIGMYLGIAITVISLLGSAKYPFFQPLFDWMLVFFVGLAVFFFFMAIRLNTEENTDVKIEDIPQSDQKRQTKVTSYQTHLNRFNILSKSSFTISGVLGALALFRLLGMLLSSLG